MSVKAKFQVLSVLPSANFEGTVDITLQAVTGEGNEDWAKATPAGVLTLSSANENASEQFSEGDIWMLALHKENLFDKAIEGVEDLLKGSEESEEVDNQEQAATGIPVVEDESVAGSTTSIPVISEADATQETPVVEEDLPQTTSPVEETAEGQEPAINGAEEAATPAPENTEG